MITLLVLQLALLLFLPGIQLPGVEYDSIIETAQAREVVAKPVIPDGHLPSSGSRLRPPRKKRPESLGVAVTAKNAIVTDARTGEVLFAKDADTVVPLASLTKLAAALVFVETKPEWGKKVTISATDMRGGGVEYLIPGESVTVEELFGVALVGSSNTAIAALARRTGLGEEEFVKRMNAKVASLGLSTMHFVEPTGLHRGNVGTAREISQLAQVAFLEPKIRQAVTTQSMVVRPENARGTKSRTVRTTDALLGTFLAKPPYAIIGGKTGSLGADVGYHFVMEVSNGESRPVIVAVLGSDSNGSRFQDAKSLAVWTFETWSWK